MKLRQASFGRNESKCDYADRERLIDAYSGNTLSETEAEEFEDHFFGCEICSVEIRMLQELQPVIATNENVQIESAEVSTKKSSWTSSKYVIAAIVVLGLVIGFRLFLDAGVNNQEDGLAARMSPSPHYEQLIRQDWRSGSLENILPQNFAEISGSVSFSWIDTKEEKMILSIYSNTDLEVISRRGVLPPQSVNTQTKNMLPGLYYWSLEGESGLRHIGKFIVKN